MASLFSARRKPKRIARDDPSQAEQDDGMFPPPPHVKHCSDNFSFSRRLADEQHLDSGPVVRRPGAVKQKSKLRVSFNPGDAEVEDSSNVPSEDDTPVVKPTSRLGASAALQDRLKQASLRENGEIERPSYSKSYLDELQNSTPSTPKELATPPGEDEQRMIDIESKFGPSKPSSFSNANATHIPSATEIAEKKARRARLALSPGTEQQVESENFIPLDSYDSDGEFKPPRLQVGTYLQPEKQKDTRLEREDEDIGEGFEQFIEDDPGAVRGRYSTDALQLNRKLKKKHVMQERAKMKAMIEHAEASETDSEDEQSDISDRSASDQERRHAYESAQTHRGLDGLSSHREQKVRERRPRQPKETTPIVKLSVGLGRLREQVAAIQVEKGRLERRLEEVKKEKGEVRERQRVVQEGLEGLGREMEALQNQGQGVGGGVAGVGVNGNGDSERGLESFGMRDEKGDVDEMEQ